MLFNCLSCFFFLLTYFLVIGTVILPTLALQSLLKLWTRKTILVFFLAMLFIVIPFFFWLWYQFYLIDSIPLLDDKTKSADRHESHSRARLEWPNCKSAWFSFLISSSKSTSVSIWFMNLLSDIVHWSIIQVTLSELRISKATISSSISNRMSWIVCCYLHSIPSVIHVGLFDLFWAL